METIRKQIKKEAIQSHIISLSTAFDKELSEVLSGDDAHLLSTQEVEKRFKHTLRTFFKKYDLNGDGVIDKTELRLLLGDLNEKVDEGSFFCCCCCWLLLLLFLVVLQFCWYALLIVFFCEGAVNDLLKEINCDRTGVINFDQFCVAMETIVKRGLAVQRRGSISRVVFQKLSIHDQTDEETVGMTDYDEPNDEEDGILEEGGDDDDNDDDDGDDDDDDASEMPKWKILTKSAFMMGIGTVGKFSIFTLSRLTLCLTSSYYRHPVVLRSNG